MKLKDVTTAYHCSRCGGVAEPGRRLCPFCSQKLEEWYASQSKYPIRVLVNGIYLNSIMTLGELYNPSPLETTMIYDTARTYVPGIVSPTTFDMDFQLTKHLQEQIDYIDMKHGSEVKIEILNNGGNDMVFDFYGTPRWGLMECEVGEIAKISMSITVEDIGGWKDLLVPKNLTCPNCGAAITSRYGCCEYCGGWVEWIRKEIT